VALVTLAYLKVHLGVSGTSQDAALSQWAEGVSAAIESWCGREFARATVTEFYSTNGTRTIALRRRPVSSVTSVHLDFAGRAGQGPDTPFSSESLLAAGTDYFLDFRDAAFSYTGLLHYTSGVWPERTRQREPGKLAQEYTPQRGNVKVTYVGGYDPIPADIQFAAAQVVAYARRNAKFGGFGVTMERLGDHMYRVAQVSLGAAPELGSARQILSKYKEVPW